MHAHAWESHSPEPVVRTLFMSDLVDSTRLTGELGDAGAAEVFRHHDHTARELLRAHGGREIDKTDGFLHLFDEPEAAVRYGLAYHEALADLSQRLGRRLESRVGIHVGEVLLWENSPADVQRGAKPIEVEGLAKPVAARIMSLSSARQILLTRRAFEAARRVVEGGSERKLRWLAHGEYLLKGVDEPVEIFEVGFKGFAPLKAPPDSDKARRVFVTETVLGWRPATGLAIMGRPEWLLERQLGEGAAGEVWLARHLETAERHVFKFCFEADRVRALQREVTLFRLLRDELGERDDISRIVGWNFDEVPYVIESEYTEGGSLLDWAERQGTAASVPLATRLELVAQTADALAAAHSVGVLHKDVKPANLLVATDDTGKPRIRLTDFGIGLLADHERLMDTGFTAFGVTDLMSDTARSSYEGTRLYMAPELMEGKAASVQADMYSLGVLLYQMVVGDLTKALGPGWEREVPDELLREDIAAAVDGDPSKRLRDAAQLAERLRNLDDRRSQRLATRKAEASAARLRRRIRIGGGALVVLAVVAGVALIQARRIAREAERANREAQTSQRVTEVMVDMFRMSDPSEARGNTVTAREILDRGADRIRNELVNEPQVRATLLNVMGEVYIGLGLYQLAGDLLEEALVARRNTNGPDSPEVAETLHNLGDVRGAQRQLEEAERVLREALEIRVRQFGTDNLEVASTQHLLARVLSHEGKSDSAVALHRAALATRRHLLPEDDPDVVESLFNLAEALLLAGDGAGAEEVAAEGLAAAVRAFGELHPKVAWARGTLAAAHAAQGEWSEAEALLRRTLQDQTALFEPTHPDVMIARVNLGAILYETGRYDEAERQFRELLTLMPDQFPPGHPYLLSCRVYLGRVLLRKGAYAEAEAAAAQVLALISPELRSTPAVSRIELLGKEVRGEALLGLERYAEAEPLLLEAYEGLSQPVARQPSGARDALGALVNLYESWGKPDVAERYRRLQSREGQE